VDKTVKKNHGIGRQRGFGCRCCIRSEDCFFRCLAEFRDRKLRPWVGALRFEVPMIPYGSSEKAINKSSPRRFREAGEGSS